MGYKGLLIGVEKKNAKGEASRYVGIPINVLEKLY